MSEVTFKYEKHPYHYEIEVLLKWKDSYVMRTAGAFTISHHLF